MINFFVALGCCTVVGSVSWNSCAVSAPWHLACSLPFFGSCHLSSLTFRCPAQPQPEQRDRHQLLPGRAGAPLQLPPPPDRHRRPGLRGPADAAAAALRVQGRHAAQPVRLPLFASLCRPFLLLAVHLLFASASLSLCVSSFHYPNRVSSPCFSLRLTPSLCLPRSEIFETIYFAAVSMSCELAQEQGTYETYEGSPMSKGKLQPDMWG